MPLAGDSDWPLELRQPFGGKNQENVSGFTVGEVVIAKKVSGTGFNTEYMRVKSKFLL